MALMFVSNFGNRGHGLFAIELTLPVVLADPPLLVREDCAGNLPR